VSGVDHGECDQYANVSGREPRRCCKHAQHVGPHVAIWVDVNGYTITAALWESRPMCPSESAAKETL